MMLQKHVTGPLSVAVCSLGPWRPAGVLIESVITRLWDFHKVRGQGVVTQVRAGGRRRGNTAWQGETEHRGGRP